MGMLKLALCVLLFMRLAVLPCLGMFLQPQAFPLERVVTNTQRYLEAHPGDSDATYTLARAYYLAFANKVLEVPAYPWQEGHPSRIAPNHIIGESTDWVSFNTEVERRWVIEQKRLKELGMQDFDYGFVQEQRSKIREQLRTEGWEVARIDDEQALEFAVLSQAYFWDAIDLEPESALFWLGLASLEEQVLGFLQTRGLESKAFSGLDKQRIYHAYWKAFELSRAEDAKLEDMPVSGIKSIISYEAGKACLRLGLATRDQELAIMGQTEKMEQLRYHIVTPLVVTGPEVQVPSDFIQAGSSVAFNLDGLGEAHWEWVTPETGILVWDPDGSGEITDATQLFGNFTFGLIWRDGFHALSVLDDDANGRIDGEELDGLALWFDRNGNGASEPGELSALEELGVEALLYKELSSAGGMLVREQGVRYGDGITATLWDWVANPVEEPARPRMTSRAD